MSVEGITAPAHNNKRDWSDYSVGVLRKMWADGESAEAIGAKIGRTPHAVQNYACGLRLRRRVPRGKYRQSDEIVRDVEHHDSAMRAESRKALEAYTKAVLEAGGGSWGGHLTPLNSCGTYR